MSRIKLLAGFVIALGAFTLAAPAEAANASSMACCTSGDGKEQCCGETCGADAKSCWSKCVKDPTLCLPADQ